MFAIKKDSPLVRFYTSSIGKKFITGFTGLGLTLFVLFHMLGNLLLFKSPQAYNQLGHFIDSLGIVLYVIEFLLSIAIIFHFTLGISIIINKMRSRVIGYDRLKTSGYPSKQSLSSRSMIITGLTLLIFLVLHLWTFKFGTYYSTTINNVEMRDLARLVVEKFEEPIYTFSYLGAILFLGFHLRHGIWSGLQSLGAINSNFNSIVYGLSLVLAVLIATGFFILPLTIYFHLSI